MSTKPIIMSAKYPGRCSACLKDLAPGQVIAWYKEDRLTYHAACMPLEDRPFKDDTRLVQQGYLFVDLETGGTNECSDAIVQIGAAATTSLFHITETFSTLVQPFPGLALSDEALAINKLTRQMLETAPHESLALQQFAAFCRRIPAHRFAGYNCPFDLRFLEKLFQRHQLTDPLYLLPPLDILERARFCPQLSSLRSFKLTMVATHFGMSIAGAHDALADVRLSIAIAEKLMPGSCSPAP